MSAHSTLTDFAPPPVAPASSPPFAARALDATKVYGKGETAVRALDAVTVGIPLGRFTAVMGPSGSGKSTLMHCLAGLDNLTSGQVFLGEVDLGSLNDRQLTELRRDKIGFVFQAFNLVPTLSAQGEHHAPDGPRRPQARQGLGRHRRADRRSRHPPEAPPVGAVGRPAATCRGRPSPRESTDS